MFGASDEADSRRSLKHQTEDATPRTDRDSGSSAERTLWTFSCACACAPGGIHDEQNVGSVNSRALVQCGSTRLAAIFLGRRGTKSSICASWISSGAANCVDTAEIARSGDANSFRRLRRFNRPACCTLSFRPLGAILDFAKGCS